MGQFVDALFISDSSQVPVHDIAELAELAEHLPIAYLIAQTLLEVEIQ